MMTTMMMIFKIMNENKIIHNILRERRLANQMKLVNLMKLMKLATSETIEMQSYTFPV